MSIELGVEPHIDQTHERLQAIGLSDPRLTVATHAAIVGSRIILAIHGASPEVLQVVLKEKEGKTPKTVADERSGQAIKSLIRVHFPTCRINEEETGDEKGSGDSQVEVHVDPLDGTSSYARELRSSTVGIAFYIAGRPFASAIGNPFERELLIAQTGTGAHLFRFNEDLTDITFVRQAEVSRAKSLEGGIVFVDALFNQHTTRRKLELMDDLTRLAKNNLGFRMSGSNIDQQMKVALGRAEATITDAIGGTFDILAGRVAIEEAGGKLTDKEGSPATEATKSIAVGSNGLLHDDILELVRKSYKRFRSFKG